MWLLAVEEIEVAQAAIAGKRRRPHQRRGTGAPEIEHLHLGRTMRERQRIDTNRRAEPIAGLIHEYADAVAPEIEKIAGAGSVDIGHADARGTETIGGIE